MRSGNLKGQETAQQGRRLVAREMEVRQIAPMIDGLPEPIDLLEGPLVVLQIVRPQPKQVSRKLSVMLGR